MRITEIESDDKRSCCDSTVDVGHDFTCPEMLTAAGIEPPDRAKGHRR